MKASLCSTCGYCPKNNDGKGHVCTFFGHSVQGIVVIECIHFSEREEE